MIFLAHLISIGQCIKHSEIKRPVYVHFFLSNALKDLLIRWHKLLLIILLSALILIIQFVFD